MSSIIVGVRVRPFNQRELKYNSTNIVKMNVDANCVALSQVRQGKVLEGEKPKEFFFDYALWTHDTETVQPVADQKYTYEKLGVPVLNNVLEGYNACLFAYGQTGSGKTYSMMGYGADSGVVPRLCEDLFKHVTETHEKGAVIGEDSSEVALSIAVEASYLEIYNEVVKDLVPGHDKKGTEGLKVRQHPKTGVFVEGLKKHLVSSKDAIVKILDDGQTLRSVAATNMNATSSRSHAILLVQVSQTTTTTTKKGGEEIITTAVKTGKLSLVDLAGSERASSTGASGSTLTEGANINKSLTFLGMCLSRLAELAESGVKGGHIPFRDSSLTFLLSDNLGGNSKTSMMANISPAEINFEETLSTLRFAQMTKKVKNNAVVNENPTTKLIRELKEELELLKTELKLARERSAGPSPPKTVEPKEGASNPNASAEDEETPSVSGPLDVRSEGEALLEGTVVELMVKLRESEAAAKELEAQEGAAEDQNTPLLATTGDHSSVFVDWMRPQLVNLCPEGSVLVLPVEDGGNVYHIDPSSATAPVSSSIATEDNVRSMANTCKVTASLSFSILYSPLLNTALFRYRTLASVDAAVVVPSVNGTVLEPTGTGNGTNQESSVEVTDSIYEHALRHSDRIVFGRVAFRFSHTSTLPSMPEHSCIPSSIEHLSLLEEHDRFSSRVIPAFSGLFALYREALDERNILEPKSPRGGEPVDAFIGELDNELTEGKLLMRKAEELLIDDYPVTLEEQTKALDEWRAQALGRTTAGAIQPIVEDDYNAVVEEAKKGVEAKNEMITQLKEQIQTAAENRRRQLSILRHEEEAEEELRKKQEQEEEALVAKEVEEEMMWHARVRRIRTFSATGPVDPQDHKTWSLLGSSPQHMPFLRQVMEELAAEADEPSPHSSQVLAASVGTTGEKELPVTRCGTLYKQKQRVRQWTQRFAVIHDRFLYYYAKCDGRESARGAIYLYGATTTRPKNSKELGRKNSLLLTASCPRSPNDTHSFYLAFPTEDDLDIWEYWINKVSVPPMPESMKRRLMEEEEIAVAEGRKPARRNHVSGTVTAGEMAKFNWKRNTEVSKCEHCNKDFGVFTRRHHCHLCGGVFCDGCAPRIASKRLCGMCKTFGTERPEAEGSDFELI